MENSSTYIDWIKNTIYGKIFINFLIVYIFFILYLILDKVDPTAFAKPKGNEHPYHMFFFTMMTHTTLGYGEIMPKSKTAQTLVMIHVVIVIYINFMMETRGPVRLRKFL